MKTNAKLLLAMALLATACTPGSKVTSGGYTDDLYFTPGDAPLIVQKPVEEVKKPQQKSTVVMQVEENEQGKIVNNYVVPKSSRKDKNAYYFDDQPVYADTTLEYKDDREQVTINNYFEGEEMDYSTRIRTFYNPYFYDPFWDPFWSPYYGSSFGYGMGYGMGWGRYGSMYSGWYDPWYSGYGYGYGFGYGWGGGYYPGFGWGGGYYAGGGFGWGGGYYGGWGGNWESGNHYTGIQNHTGKRGGSNAVRYGMNNTKNGILSGGGGFNGQFMGRNPNAASTRLQSGNTVNGAVSGTRQGMVGSGATSTRLSGTRNNSDPTIVQQSQGASNTPVTRLGRGETISNLRRANTNNMQGVVAPDQNGSSTRPVSAGRDYTPTYNRPRMNTQPSYNNSSSRQYSTPQTNGSVNQSSRYARPQNASSGTVRTQSSSGFQRGSASTSVSRSAATQGSSGRSSSGYSAPSSSSRSFSAPSFNSGVSGGSVSGGSVGNSGNSGGNSGSGSGGGGGTRGGR